MTAPKKPNGHADLEAGVQLALDALEDIGLEDMAFNCGGLGKALRAYRLPERLTGKTLKWSRKMAVRGAGEGDTRPYVCVTFEDGHQAWSSPVYMFRG